MLHGVNEHLSDHIYHNDLRGDNVLHVIGVVSNTVRFHSRNRLARQWIKRIARTKCVHLTVVEAAFGDRHFEINDEAWIKEEKELNEKDALNGDEWDQIKVHISQNTWVKESLINLAFRRITSAFPNAKYFAWLDMDIAFDDSENWAQECLHQLQHFQLMQPWSEALDLGPHREVIQKFASFGQQCQKRKPMQKHPSQSYYEYAHSGFAWACTRRFAESLWGAGGSNGPLMDWSPLGSADHHQAFSAIGETKDTIHSKMSESFFRRCYEWERRAVRITGREVGFQMGFITHMHHGPKKRRYYRERWQTLIDHNFDPDTMIDHDVQGIAYLTGNRALEHAIYHYNQSRAEDSIDTV